MPGGQRRNIRTYHGISHHLPLPPHQVLSLTSLVEQREALAVKAAAQHYNAMWISLSGLATATAPALGVGAQSSDTGGAGWDTCLEGRGATLQHSDQTPLTHGAGGAEGSGCPTSRGATWVIARAI